MESDDLLILNIDDKNVEMLIPESKCKIITCSVNKAADYTAKNINFDGEFPQYDLYHLDEFLAHIELSVLGEHNIYNSLCAIAAALENKIELSQIISGLKNYYGVHRRLELKGYYNGAAIIDDYAHHPTEIKASLKALKKACTSRLFCVFQPHTFTRTKILLDSFSQSFEDTDLTIITDIYAAREKDYGDIHSKTLVNVIVEFGDTAVYMEEFSEISDYLKHELREGDIVVTMGAGDVYKIGEDILKSN